MRPPLLCSVGDVRIYRLVDVPELRIVPQEFFPSFAELAPADPVPWYLHEPWTRDGQLIYVIQGFLLISPDSTVLIDAGVGAGKTRVRPEFDHLRTDWVSSLRALDLDVSDVDHVVLTHLHVDHVGWSTRADGTRWIPTFPRAHYLISSIEFDYWSGPDGAALMARTGDYLIDSVQPVIDAGLVRWFDGDLQVTAEITLRGAPGHTPGNSYVEVRSAGEHLVLAGDLAHHPLQLARPAWSTRYCTDDGSSRHSRRRVLDAVADTDTLFVPAHFPGQPGYVMRDGSGFRFTQRRSQE